jgi:DNA-3-methyladenine glycosylase II
VGPDFYSITPSQPFSFKETLWFLDRNLDDCMHSVSPAAVRKAIKTGSGEALIEVTGTDSSLSVSVLAGSAREEEVTSLVKEWFDLERDIRPFYRLLKKDREFASLAARYKGFRMVGIPDLFECLIWSIAGQQISLPFAYTLKRRFVETYGARIIHGEHPYFLFPAPARIAALRVADLRAMQFTTRKAEYILGISKAFVSGDLSKSRLEGMGSGEERLKYLLRFRGIGPWSANYVLMKSLRDMNCVPYGDAGLNQALLKIKKFPRSPEKEVKHLLRDFEGWRTYLVYYLWRSLREMA